MGRLGPLGIPGPDHASPPKNSGHGAVLCLIRGPVWDPGNGLSQEQGNFLSVQVSFYGQGLNFDSSEMIYIKTHQQIK